jgi:hypothetical protein
MIGNIAPGASMRHAAAAGPVEFATCPLCHAKDPVVTSEDGSRGGDWTCSRCSHPWDRIRLANAAAYSASLSLQARPLSITPGGNSNGAV